MNEAKVKQRLKELLEEIGQRESPTSSAAARRRLKLL